MASAPFADEAYDSCSTGVPPVLGAERAGGLRFRRRLAELANVAALSEAWVRRPCYEALRPANCTLRFWPETDHEHCYDIGRGEHFGAVQMGAAAGGGDLD